MATGSDGAGTASPPGSLGRDGGFCPGNKKEKGWGSLGGFFSGGGVLPLFFFPSSFFQAVAVGPLQGTWYPITT